MSPSGKIILIQQLLIKAVHSVLWPIYLRIDNSSDLNVSLSGKIILIQKLLWNILMTLFFLEVITHQNWMSLSGKRILIQQYLTGISHFKRKTGIYLFLHKIKFYGYKFFCISLKNYGNKKKLCKDAIASMISEFL